MSLEEILLADYGTIPQKVGTFLLRNNSVTLDTLKASVDLTEHQIQNALVILIQRRVVKFFIFEKSIKYFLDREILKRRLYFPLYTHYIASKYSKEHVDFFIKVLVGGIYKEVEESKFSADFQNADILQLEGNGRKKDDFDSKHRKKNQKYLILNFNLLDQKIFEMEMCKYVAKRYNEATSHVLKAMLCCDIINRDNIIKNLQSTKILISENQAIIHEKDNVNEYLSYLCFDNIVHRGFDQSRAFFLDSSTRSLKIYKVNLLLNDDGCRRIFNMICSKIEVDDKDTSLYSLLSVNKVKQSLLSIQKLGIISQKCVGNYKTENRIEHSWTVDFIYASKSIRRRIEDRLLEKLQNINKCWDVNYFMDDTDGNVNVWISDMLSLGTDHLIFSLD